MEAVVDCDLAVRLCLAPGERLEHGLFRLRFDEVDDRGGAAAGGGHGPGGKRVTGDQAGERHLQVDMFVDGAGDHVAAGRVDDLCALQIATDGDDGLALDRQVGGDGAAVGDEEAVVDDEVIHGSPELLV